MTKLKKELKHYVYKDNKLIFIGSEEDCFEHVLWNQFNSVNYACLYDGYKILSCEMKW